MISLTELGNYHDPEAVGREFERLIQRLRGFLSQAFDPDGQLIVADPNLAIFAVGDTKPTFRTSAQLQSGWLLCDGTAVSRTKYQDLFSVIGTTYGVGDGSTTFNLPNMQQRFPLGKAASGTGSTLGSTGGAIDHTHSTGSHTHSIGSDGSHSHTVNSHTHTFSGTTDVTGATSIANGAEATSNTVHEGHTHPFSGTTDGASPGTNSQGSHDHGGVTGSASGGTSGTGNPPYIVVNFVIYSGVAA